MVVAIPLRVRFGSDGRMVLSGSNGFDNFDYLGRNRMGHKTDEATES
jgi:hypothetical protein